MFPLFEQIGTCYCIENKRKRKKWGLFFSLVTRMEGQNSEIFSLRDMYAIL